MLETTAPSSAVGDWKDIAFVKTLWDIDVLYWLFTLNKNVDIAKL